MRMLTIARPADLEDAVEMALRIRPRAKPFPHRRRPVRKFVGLWTPIRSPHGWQTNASQDPRRNGTKPSQFVADRSYGIVEPSRRWAVDAFASSPRKRTALL